MNIVSIYLSELYERRGSLSPTELEKERERISRQKKTLRTAMKRALNYKRNTPGYSEA